MRVKGSVVVVVTAAVVVIVWLGGREFVSPPLIRGTLCRLLLFVDEMKTTWARRISTIPEVEWGR